MRAACILIATIALGCSSYRLEWQGFGKREGEPSVLAPRDDGKSRLELTGEKIIPPTPETVWIAWKTQHDNLERAMSRRSREAPVPSGIFDSCRDMLALLERQYPDHVVEIEAARAAYTSVEERARVTTTTWSQRKLEGIRRNLQAVRDDEEN